MEMKASIPAWAYEAERAFNEAYAHLGLDTLKKRAVFDERVRQLHHDMNMEPVAAIRWAESEWANRGGKP